MNCFFKVGMPTLLAAIMLAGCGGGRGDDVVSAPQPQPEFNGAVSPVPAASGDTASDALTRFNLRRQQLGLRVLARTAPANNAAQKHADYQKVNDTITHEQIPGAMGFTGATLGDRLAAAGYRFQSAYAYGEVLSATSDPSGVRAADDLIAAVYHRFVIFDPVFKEVGLGAATASSGRTYLATNFVANGLDGGLGIGRIVVYPFPEQNSVPRNFFSDQEIPDPVPARNEVGYPISVHADITARIAVQEFLVRPRGGNPLPVRVLQNSADPLTPPSAASIVPLSPLERSTTYDVRFVGTVDALPVSKEWSFTT